MKIPAILGSALVLQLLLALGLFWNGMRDAVVEESVLLDFEVARVDRLVVDDNLGTAVVVRQDDGGWALPELHDLPGAGARIDRVLADLAAVRMNYPIATTASARERFEVAEERFQRHVQFFDGERLLGELYLGTSPGLRQTHTRRAGEDAIYNLPISSFEFAGDNNDWMDKSLLAMSGARGVQGPDFSLEKNGDAWVLADLEEGELLEQSRATEIASALASLRVLRVADRVPENPEWRMYSVANDEVSHDYWFAADEEDNRYYVRRDDLAPVFTLGKADFDRIAKTREQLLVAVEEDAPQEPEEEGDTQEAPQEPEEEGDTQEAPQEPEEEGDTQEAAEKDDMQHAAEEVGH